jgi:CDP-glucose 4,6-dehydratase
MVNWKTKNVMVTGGDGFIGTKLVAKLRELGANVFVYDLTRCQDVRNYKQVHEFAGQHDIQIIYHLAACSQVPIANSFPLTALDTNILGTSVVLEIARIMKLEKVIIASSDHAYGNSDNSDENHQLNAEYPYDVSKMCADVISKMYSLYPDTNVVVARMCNIFGGGDLNWQRLIPEAIRSAVYQIPLVIRGNEKMEREWLHVDDAVDAYVKLGDAPLGTYNFGGEPRTVGEILKYISARLDLVLYRREPPKTVMEIKKLSINDEKSFRVLNWKIQVPFMQGMERTMEWYVDYLKGRKSA